MARLLPSRAKFSLRFIEATAGVTSLGLPAIFVCRRIRVVRNLFRKIRTAVVGFTPVGVLGRGIDCLGRCMPSQPACHSADHRADDRSHGSTKGSPSGTSGGPGRCSTQPGSDRMCPFFTCDGIAIRVRFVHFLSGHSSPLPSLELSYDGARRFFKVESSKPRKKSHWDNQSKSCSPSCALARGEAIMKAVADAGRRG